MDQRLSKAAEKLSALVSALPANELGPLLDLTVGGLASLIWAEQLNYLNRKSALPPIYYEGLSDRVEKMAIGTLPPAGPWLAGYYFNSGLMRLGAAREQTRGLLNGLVRKTPELQSMPQLTKSELDELHQEVNFLKHDLLGLSGGRRIMFEHAVCGLVELVDVIGAWKKNCQVSVPRSRRWDVSFGEDRDSTEDFGSPYIPYRDRRLARIGAPQSGCSFSPKKARLRTWKICPALGTIFLLFVTPTM
jgi:hypothetical protein